MPKIYTIGSSSRGIDEFIGLLKKHQIKRLIDVRRFPTSKFEYFKKENLSTLLAEVKIEYVYLGKELGGFRRGGYQEYMKTSEFRQAFRILEEIGKAGVSCFMCCERDPRACHRRFITQKLRGRGWRVVDII